MASKRSKSEIKAFKRFKWAVGALLLVCAAGALALANVQQADVVAAASPTATTTATATPRLTINDSLTKSAPIVLIERKPILTQLTLMADMDVVKAGDSLLLYGSAEEGSLIKLRTENGFLAGETVADSAESYRIDVLFETLGTFVFTAEATLPDGGVLKISDPVTIVAEMPDAPVVAPTLNELFSAEFAQAETLSFDGTATPLTMLGVFINGTLFDAIQVDLDGRWAYQAQFPETGNYAVYVQTLTETEEEVESSAEIKFAIGPLDLSRAEVRPTEVPTAIITPTLNSSVPSGLFPSGTVDISGRANPAYTLEVVVNREVIDWLIPADNGDWSYKLAFEAPDTYTAYVRSVADDGTWLAVSDYVALSIVPPNNANNDGNDDPCDGFFALGAYLPNGLYAVANCETYSSIADRSGTDIETLRRVNPDVDPTQLQPGQIINLPTP